MKRNVFDKLISLPKSLYVSYRLTDIKKFWRFPILVRYNVVLKELRGQVIFDNCSPVFGLIQIGFNQVNILDLKYQRGILEIGGKLIVKGRCTLGNGARLSISPGGELSIGKDFRNNAGMTLICFKNITFGSGVLVSWDTMIMDTDFHQTIDLSSNVIKEKEGVIKIGNNCWICYGATILKNTFIPDGVIVSSKSLVKGIFYDENSIIGGIPARCIKKEITLYRE